MRYKAVIFDLDGVICHTDKYHYNAWKDIADQLGIPFNEEINHRLRGVSRMESLEIILEQYQGVLSKEEKEAYASEKNINYVKLLKEMSQSDLDPEVKSTLDQLRNSGVKLAIGSSSKNAKLILNQIGLKGYFDAISDGNNISKSKPDPEVFLKASEYLLIAPKDCLVVEDAVAGIDAAKAAGMDQAAIGEAISLNMASYNLVKFSDLLKI